MPLQTSLGLPAHPLLSGGGGWVLVGKSCHPASPGDQGPGGLEKPQFLCSVAGEASLAFWDSVLGTQLLI